ncbi:MAG: hypothetical protein JW751_28680 [Polyangiaceae bacterium]|nr:hypothetical protein [Polyangiaceae bacterium]
MKVPSDLDKDMEVHTTKHRRGVTKNGGGFEFGPYRVDEVKRKWSNEKGFDVFENFTPEKDAGYRYHFEGGGDRSMTGKCAIPAPEKVSELDGTVTVKERDAAIACLCELGSKLEAQLFVEDLAGEFGGPVIVRNVELFAHGIHTLANGDKVKAPAGYQIDADDGPVGAVEVLPGKARVWIRDDLKKADSRALSCALAGLMLFEPQMPVEKKKKRGEQ